jgi:hypothetical protein
MIRPIDHFSWQVLRTLVRAKGPLSGKTLRVSPSRRSYDGTFLDVLVTAGLLEVARVDPAPELPPWKKPGPVQFHTLYRLTARGKEAAEFGQYDDQIQFANRPPAEAKECHA